MFLLLIFLALVSGCEGDSDGRGTRPNEGSSLPGYIVEEKSHQLPAGEALSVTIGSTQVEVPANATTIDSEVRLRVLASVPNLDEIADLEAAGEIVDIAFYDKKTGEAFGSEILQHPYTATQTIDNLKRRKDLHYILVTNPNDETSSIKQLPNSSLEMTELALVGGKVQISLQLRATQILFFGYEANEPISTVIGISSAIDLETQGGGTIAGFGGSNLQSTLWHPATWASNSKSPLITWFESDYENFSHYEIALGTVAGEADIKNWQEIGLATSHQFSDLQLSIGATYFPSVRAVDLEGQFSTSLQSKGWLVTEHQLSIGANACITKNQRAYCWGAGTYGQLGSGDTANYGNLPGHTGTNLRPVTLLHDLQIDSVHSAATTYCALTMDQKLLCWGRSIQGNLGREVDIESFGDNSQVLLESPSFINFGVGRTVLNVGVGSGRSCALLDNQTVKCWGAIVGDGDTVAIGDDVGEMGDSLAAISLPENFLIKKIEVGSSIACVLSLGGKVSCFGSTMNLENNSGGSTRLVLPSDQQGYGAVVDFGTNDLVVDIELGLNHGCALFTSGRIKCWGSGFANLGYGYETTAVFVRPNETAANRTDSTHISKMPYVDLGSNAKVDQIALGWDHSCALLESGVVKCWGDNTAGVTGNGTNAPSIGLNNGMGDNLGPVDLGDNLKVKQIHAGGRISCATFENATAQVKLTPKLKCWGINSSGQLRLGNTTIYGTNPLLMGDNLPFIDLQTGE